MSLSSPWCVWVTLGKGGSGLEPAVGTHGAPSFPSWGRFINEGSAVGIFCMCLPCKGALYVPQAAPGRSGSLLTQGREDPETVVPQLPTALGTKGIGHPLYQCATYCLCLVSTTQAENCEQHPPQNKSPFPARLWARGGLQHPAAGREHQVWRVRQGHGSGQGVTIFLENKWPANFLSRVPCFPPEQCARQGALRAGGSRRGHAGPGQVGGSPEQ